MGKAKFIGEEAHTSFITGNIYDFKEGIAPYGKYYDILDESGEWYEYGYKYFDANFEVL